MFRDSGFRVWVLAWAWDLGFKLWGLAPGSRKPQAGDLPGKIGNSKPRTGVIGSSILGTPNRLSC